MKIRETDPQPKEELEELLTQLYKELDIVHIQIFKFGTNMWKATIIYKDDNEAN